MHPNDTMGVISNNKQTTKHTNKQIGTRLFVIPEIVGSQAQVTYISPVS